MRTRVIALAVIVASVALAPASPAAAATSSPKRTVITLPAIECPGISYRCNNPFKLGVSLRKGARFSFQYAAGGAHCATVTLHVTVGGREAGTVTVAIGQTSGERTFTAPASGNVAIDGESHDGCVAMGGDLGDYAGTVTIGPPKPAPSITGHVLVTCEGTCKEKGAKGITILATGTKGSPRRATTDVDGFYALEDLEKDSSYTLTPQLSHDAEADPASLTVSVTDGKESGKDFRICPGLTGTITRAAGAGAAEPCERTYYVQVQAWLPYGSIADPVIGSPDGAAYPESPYGISSTLHLSDPAYPPCIPAKRLDAFKDARPDLLFRGRFGGDNHIGYGTPGFGTVTVPIIYNRETEQLRVVRAPSVQPGSLRRIYDYTVNGVPQPSCSVDRPVVPEVGVYQTQGNRSFEIHVSYPIPFKPFEDAGDLKDFADAAKPLTGAAKKKLDDELKQIPGYASLPAAARAKVDAYALKAGDAIGLGPAISAVKAVLKGGDKVNDVLTALSPPPVKLGKRALAILQKAAYGSADIRIEGSFSRATASDDTILSTATSSDGFPSFGFSVTRSRPQGGTESIPWRGSQSVLSVNDAPAELGDNVTGSALVSTGVERILQGDPGGKLAVLTQLGVMANVSPRPFGFAVKPLIKGSPPATHVAWRFLKGGSSGR